MWVWGTGETLFAIAVVAYLVFLATALWLEYGRGKRGTASEVEKPAGEETVDGEGGSRRKCSKCGGGGLRRYPLRPPRGFGRNIRDYFCPRCQGTGVEKEDQVSET